MLGAVASFFALLLVFVVSPFATQVAPADGAGLNPSLQNPYMMIHPPFLYLGYVGLTIPFAFAMGALLARRTDERWIVATRRWTLFAWTALGIGQLLGAHWAYVEVGWGGYYAWDPVENAALMPWLAATAFLHSVMIQEKRGMLKVWNMLLVVLAFCLALFGTFLTRSGVVNSIHSFTQSSIGPWFLTFIALTLAASLALLFWRLPLLRSPTRLESPISREAAFLYNNLLLLALCLTILWGVVYPLLSEAVRGESVVLGRSYYDFFLRIFGLPLLLLMGIGPLIAWRRASARSLVTTFRWPTVAALVAGVSLIFLGPIVSDYLKRYPEVRIDLFCTGRMVDLVEERFDLGIRAGTLTDSTLGGRARERRWRTRRGRGRSRRSSPVTAGGTGAMSFMPRSSCSPSESPGRAPSIRLRRQSSSRVSRCGSATTRSATESSRNSRVRTRWRCERGST